MANKPNPMDSTEQREGGPIDRMNQRRDAQMKSYKGDPDPFSSSHPSEKRAEAFQKRYGFRGELDKDQRDSMNKNEADAAQNKAKDKSSAMLDSATKPPSYKKGGMVKRTGLAHLHKGEKVLTTRQVKKLGGGKKKSAARKRG